MDPDLFYAEPVSAVFFNADPDPTFPSVWIRLEAFQNLHQKIKLIQNNNLFVKVLKVKVFILFSFCLR